MIPLRNKARLNHVFSNRGSYLNGCWPPTETFRESGCFGLIRKFHSAGTTALGTAKTSEVPLLTHSVPTSLVAIKGGLFLQLRGRLFGSSQMQSASSNSIGMLTYRFRISGAGRLTNISRAASDI